MVSILYIATKLLDALVYYADVWTVYPSLLLISVHDDPVHPPSTPPMNPAVVAQVSQRRRCDFFSVCFQTGSMLPLLPPLTTSPADSTRCGDTSHTLKPSSIPSLTTTHASLPQGASVADTASTHGTNPHTWTGHERASLALLCGGVMNLTYHPPVLTAPNKQHSL